jgi:PAP2 superfamily
MANYINKKSILFFTMLALFISACQNDDNSTPTENYLGKKTREFDSKVATDWSYHTLNLIKTTKGYTPPVASRALGYLGVTLYEAVRPGTSNRTMAGQLNALSSLPKPENNKEYYWPAAANAALAKANTYFFPASEAKKAVFDSIEVIKKFYQAEYKKAGVTDEILTRSEKFGEATADAIYAWSKTDVIGHEAYLKNFPAAYEVPVGPEKWVPTSAQLIPMQPYWGNSRAFVAGAINSATPPLPIAFSLLKNSTFYEQGNMVYNTVKNITAEQRKIALFWADGGGTVTPPGHSVAIATQLVAEKNETLDRAAEVLLRVGIATSDAFVCCWKCKYVYNLQRPVTYIQKNIDPTWKPVIATPPFPEYISGHATQSGATAYVLASLYGSNVTFVDKTHKGRTDIDGAPRVYKNFMEMADEAASSRLYGGIHYPMGNQEGLLSGLKIGKAHDAIKIK